MRIIQHRYNDPNDSLYAKSVEIDVHVIENGSLAVKHDPDSIGVRASYFAKNTPNIDGFFVDIKQNLSVPHLKRIVGTFGKKLLGIFDVPFPSAYFATKAGLPVYARLSEFEPVQMLFDKFWLDPLVSWTPKKYLELFGSTSTHHKVVVAAPSLHGHSCATDIRVAQALERADVCSQIEGFVTKHPRRVSRALGV